MSARAVGWGCAILAGGLIAFCEFALNVHDAVSLFMFAQFGLGIVAGMAAEIADHQPRKGRRK